MWVLSTDRAELHHFTSPEDIPDEYAALSHTWNNKPGHGPPEQSFQDVRKIQEKCAWGFTNYGRNPRNYVGEKIRRCCELAEKHGYKWVWIDTCCIDKSSSAELSEAINSMFRYYALAGICYGYLRDVYFSHEELESEGDQYHRNPRYWQFRQSIWFDRGWTLQELIAPRFFVFLSSSWEVIGTKADLAEWLEEYFGIPAKVLRLQVSYREFSIAQRMSWFQLRQTTRTEDEAYCLLGFFGIHMSPLYGEGRNAFRRLQEEIMKQSADTTLFAWTGIQTNSPTQCLLAASPADFDMYRDVGIVYAPPRQIQVPADTTHHEHFGVRGDVNDMTFTVTTPTGICAKLPIFVWNGRIFGDLHWSSSQGRRVFLHLKLDSDSQASSLHRLSYQVGNPRLTGLDPDGDLFDVRPPDGPPSWKDVLISHRLSLSLVPGQLPNSTMSKFTPAIPMQLTFGAPVRFPEARIRQFCIQSEFDRFEIRGAGLYSPWTADSSLPTAYIFVKWSHSIIIKIGQCQQRVPDAQRRPKAIWTKVNTGRVRSDNIGFEADISTVSNDTLHCCSQDHVSQWPNLRKRFEMADEWLIGHVEEVTLSFAPCPLNPGRTLILAASYRRMLR